MAILPEDKGGTNGETPRAHVRERQAVNSQCPGQGLQEGPSWAPQASRAHHPAVTPSAPLPRPSQPPKPRQNLPEPGEQPGRRPDDLTLSHSQQGPCSFRTRTETQSHSNCN